MNQEIKPFLNVVRAEFLTLSIVIGLVGASLAFHHGVFDLISFVLSFCILIFLHITVNSLNAVSDARRGIDRETNKTRFSGGIETIVKNRIEQRNAKRIGYFFLIATVPIFIHFGVKIKSIVVPIIALVAFICVFGYTDFFARRGLGEIAAGIGLGSLPVFSLYFFQSGTFNPEIIYISALSGIPVFNLLLINEYPDIEVDRKYGRHNIPIGLGRRKGLIIYGIATFTYCLGIIGTVLTTKIPQSLLLTFISLPLAIKVLHSGLRNNNTIKEKQLKQNVQWVHLTYILTALGLLGPKISFLLLARI